MYYHELIANQSIIVLYYHVYICKLIANQSKKGGAINQVILAV